MIILIFYPILLGIIYKFMMIPIWGYMGFPDIEIGTLIRNILILEINFITIFIIAKKTKQILFSDILITLFLSSSGSAVILLSESSQIDQAFQISFSILIAFFISRISPYSLTILKTIKSYLPSNKKDIRFIFLFMFIFFGIILFTSSIDFNFLNLGTDPAGNIFSKEGVSQRPNYFTTSLGVLGAVYSYTNLLFRYVLSPFLIVYSLRNKKIILYLITVSFLILFAIYGKYKADLILPFLITFIFLINNKKSSQTLSMGDILKPHGIFLLFSTIFYFFTNDSLLNFKMIFSNLIMRSYFIQGRIMWDYYDFFTKNTPIYLSNNTLLKSFYPYDEILPRLIGGIYGGGRVNSNWLSVEGFASFGSAYGAIIGAILVGIVLAIFNNHLKKYAFTKISLAFIYPLSIPFCDIPFSTCLISGGLIAFIILSSKFPKSFGLKTKIIN